MLKISVSDVLLPTLTTWGRPVRKSRIQLQREVFREVKMVLAIDKTGECREYRDVVIHVCTNDIRMKQSEVPSAT